jgi:hypothetical protein
MTVQNNSISSSKAEKVTVVVLAAALEGRKPSLYWYLRRYEKILRSFKHRYKLTPALHNEGKIGTFMMTSGAALEEGELMCNIHLRVAQRCDFLVSSLNVPSLNVPSQNVPSRNVSSPNVPRTRGPTAQSVASRHVPQLNVPQQ